MLYCWTCYYIQDEYIEYGTEFASYTNHKYDMDLQLKFCPHGKSRVASAVVDLHQ